MKPETRRRVMLKVMAWIRSNECIEYDSEGPFVYKSMLVMGIEEVHGIDHRTTRRWLEWMQRYKLVMRLDDKRYRIIVHQETIENSILKVR